MAGLTTGLTVDGQPHNWIGGGWPTSQLDWWWMAGLTTELTVDGRPHNRIDGGWPASQLD